MFRKVFLGLIVVMAMAHGIAYAGTEPFEKVGTYSAQFPPARTVPALSGTEGICINSMVGAGAVISGGRVESSILYSGAKVEDDASVQDCILFEGVRVGPEAQLRRCVVDKGVAIPVREEIGYDLPRDRERFSVSDRGIVYVPKGFTFDSRD